MFKPHNGKTHLPGHYIIRPLMHFGLFKKYKITYRIIPNRGAVRQGNGVEIHNLETELMLSVFKSKLYHY